MIRYGVWYASLENPATPTRRRCVKPADITPSKCSLPSPDKTDSDVDYFYVPDTPVTSTAPLNLHNYHGPGSVNDRPFPMEISDEHGFGGATTRRPPSSGSTQTEVDPPIPSQKAKAKPKPQSKCKQLAKRPSGNIRKPASNLKRPASKSYAKTLFKRPASND